MIEEGNGVRLLLAVPLILWIARSGLGGCLAGGVLGSGGEGENKGHLSLRGTLVVQCRTMPIDTSANPKHDQLQTALSQQQQPINSKASLKVLYDGSLKNYRGIWGNINFQEW